MKVRKVLFSLGPPRQVFRCQEIDGVSDSYSNVQTVQFTAGRLTDCPLTMYESGRYAV